MEAYTPKEEYISAYLKQIKENPDAFFAVDQNMFNLPEFKCKAPIIAVEAKEVLTRKNVNSIMKKALKSKVVDYAKLLNSLTSEAEEFAGFKWEVEQKLQGVTDKKEMPFYTPEDFIVDAIVNVIELEPSIFESVATEFFSSEKFINEAPNAAVNSKNKTVSKSVNKIKHKAKKNQVNNVNELNKYNEEVHAFENMISETTKKNLAEIKEMEIIK